MAHQFDPKVFVPRDNNQTRSAFLVGYNPATGPSMVEVDDEGRLLVRNLIWNSGSLAWEAMTGGGAVGTLVEVTNFPATYPVTDGGGSLTVDGSVTVNNLPATQDVNVQNFPSSQPVSGDVTVSLLGDLLEATKQLLRTITRPLSVDPSTSRMRVAVESAAVTMTGVTTVTNLNQLAGFDAKQTALYSLDRSNYALNVRNRIT